MSLQGPPRLRVGFTSVAPITFSPALRVTARRPGSFEPLKSAEATNVESEGEEDIAAALAEQRAKDEKLWAAAEKGDAELVRLLIEEEGAAVNSQPTLPEAEDDGDGDGDENEFEQTTVELSEEEKEAEAQRKKEKKAKKEAELANMTKEEIKEMEEKAARKKERKKKKAEAANKGPSALHLACAGGHSSAACALVDLGADVNLLTDDLSTPLHLAVVGGHTDVVQCLVTLGADLKAKNRLGKTPLGMGKEAGTSPKILELLETFTELMKTEGEAP